MRIIRLTAENLKRLVAVDISPTGDVIVVSGKNGQGKTSVLDAIWFALGGKDAQRDTARPIRDGEDHAEVTLDLGDVIVTRRWTSNDKSTLTVTSKDGDKFASPQTMLDDLVGRLSFDPLQFARLAEKEQVATLLSLLDLPFDPAELDQRKRGYFDRRTELNRSVKQLQAERRAAGAVPDGTPDEEVSAVDVIASIRHAEAWQTTASAYREREDALARREQELQAELAQVAAERLDMQTKIGELPDPLPDPATYAAQLEQLEDTNRWVRVKVNLKRLDEALANLEHETDQLTKQMQELDDYKTTVLTQVQLPLNGLGFTEDGVTYQDVPFKQCSSAEQLKVSVAMAIALNPKLKVIRVTDGSLLDAENMALLTDMAQRHDAQIWVEKVEDHTGVAIVIEDGQVKS